MSANDEYFLSYSQESFTQISSQNGQGFIRSFQHSSNYYKLTKVRIVFNASATCEGKILNTESLPGPKLQSDITDILVKFRKEPVALVGDISQMYHQLVLLPDDRPFHRFLWRNLDQSKEAEVYEFIRFVLGDVTAHFVISLYR